VLAQVQLERGFKSIVVRSEDGLDEISTSASTDIWDVTSGELRHEKLNPADLRISPATLEQLRGGDARHNAEVVRAIIAGRSDGNLGAIRDVVALNSAATMVAYDAAVGSPNFGSTVTSVLSRIRAALPVAYKSLDTGAAESVLDVWVSVSQRYALAGE
jgi:anthranilate phosphoribosyltransferase